MREEKSVTIELNPKARRIYDRLRGRVVRQRPGDHSSVRDLALLLPDLTVLLGRLLRDERVPLADKALALFGVGYVLSPIDLLPAFLFGPVGMLDDLFVVATALSRLVNHVHPDVVRSHWSGQGDALEAIQRVTSWSEKKVVARLPASVRGWLGNPGS